jgi:hypothetical protein
VGHSNIGIMKTRQVIRGKLMLSETALELIRDKRIRRKLAEALDVTDKVIQNYINRNDDKLTKAAAMIVIREETKLDDDEILVASTV